MNKWLGRAGWLLLQMTSALGRRRYPFTVTALQSTWRVLSEDSWFRQRQPSFLLTPSEAWRFLIQGMAYTERRLQLLAEIEAFRVDDIGVRRLLSMYKRWYSNSTGSYEATLDDIYRDPLYPAYQHISQAFWNLITGRQPFVIKAIPSLSSELCRICDIGCGAGLLLGDILEQNSRAHAIGVDVGHAILDHAQKVLFARGLRDRVVLVEGDIRRLPITTSSIDLVVATEVLEHLPDPVFGLTEICRVLNPGGYLVASVPVRCSLPGHLRIFDSVEDVLALLRATGLVLVSKQVRYIAPTVPDVLLLARRMPN